MNPVSALTEFKSAPSPNMPLSTPKKALVPCDTSYMLILITTLRSDIVRL